MQIVSLGIICMKCQSLFSEKEKNNINNLSSADFFPESSKRLNMKVN